MSWTAASDVPSGTWVVIATRYSMVSASWAGIGDVVMKLRCADSALWSVTHGRDDVRPGVARAGVVPQPTPPRSGQPACRYGASRGRRPSPGPRARVRGP